MDLTTRKKKILRAIVESYIATAEPVGSKAVVELLDDKISSATIRNEMADLEEMGYLEKPHTSAGRIPSPKGYRLYVNELMEEQRLTMEETKQISDSLKDKMAALDKVIDQAGKMISQMTNYPAFAMTAASKKAAITRYNLLPVDSASFITVLMTDTGNVENKVIRSSIPVTPADLEALANMLNHTFTGLTREELSVQLKRSASDINEAAYSLILPIILFAMDTLESIESKSVYTTGASHILDQPEYQDINKARQLLTYMNDASGLSNLAIPTQQNEKGTKIMIGPENIAEELKDTSVILASYDIGDGLRGVVGVVGPTRMDYAKVAAKLSCVADSISQIFGKSPTDTALKEPEEKQKLPAGNPNNTPLKEDS